MCHHQYHLACLARSRARARPAACALCRAPWPEAEDAALSRACNDHGVNPFVDSDPEPPAGRPIGAPDPRLHPPAPAPLPPPPPAPWRQQGPPDGLILAGANSWLYVPLLHAAAGDLAPSAIEAWRSAPPASPWWEAARAHLAAAAPVSAAELHTSLRAHAATGAAAAAAAISAAASQLPRDARVHFGWACRALADGAGYIPAAAQEVLLQLYGGLRFAAELDARSEAFRVPQGAPRPAPSARRARRRAQPEPPHASVVPISDSDGSAEMQPPPTARLVASTHADSSSRSDQLDDTRPAPVPASTAVPLSAWTWLDTVDLQAEFALPLPTIRAPPRFLQPALLKCFLIPLRILNQSRATQTQKDRAWALFLLAPRLLLYRSHHRGSDGRAALLRRADAFQAGRWPDLLASSREASPPPAPPPPPRTTATDAPRRRHRACAQVRTGDLSRARQTLTSPAVAPGTLATLQALTDPERRPPALRRPIPDHLLRPGAPPPVRLTPQEIGDALRTAKRGAAPGLSGATMEHYKVFLEDEEALHLFSHAINKLATADVPAHILAALARARLTALAKPGGGVRGIATGDAFRRLTSRALARHFATTFDMATRPYQFALQTRAGTDALAALLRASTDLDPTATVVSLDGRSAYDSVSRAAILTKVHEVAPSLLPFVHAFYGSPSVYYWYDGQGDLHEIRQGEGIEQGDSLAPALFALAQHGALEAAAGALAPGDRLLAFLDDVCVVTTPERARAAYDTVSRAIAAHTGISSNLGKTRVFNHAGGPPPPGIAELGPDVWVSNRPLPERGFVALGVPIGSPEFIAARAAARLQEEAGLLTELPELPDLQAAWLLLTFCAAPRAQHLLRTVPPSLSRQYANDHDEAIWQTLLALLGRDDAAPPTSRHLAFLPARLGGLGLFGAALAAPAAYWAGWVDSLAVLAQRAPAAADRYLRDLVRGPAAAAACLREADAAAQQLDAAGWQGRPTWTTLADQAVPPPPPLEDSEPGLWRHGWQHPAALALTTSFRERTVFPQLSLATRALVRSQAGAAAGAWLSTIPSESGTTFSPLEMLLALRRRLRLPLPITLARCGQAPGTHGCGRALDPYGDHMAACPRTGALARRGHLLEQAWVRVCREAVGPEGRVIPQQWLAATTAQPIPADDRRRLDLVIHGATPLGHALCCDATLVSPLTRDGAPWARAADQDGIALVHARRRKERRYPELLRPGPHRFLVLACETGGRWSRECHDLLRLLVATRARRAHAAIRAAASTAWRRRWWGILSATQQRAIASTLLGST